MAKEKYLPSVTLLLFSLFPSVFLTLYLSVTFTWSGVWEAKCSSLHHNILDFCLSSLKGIQRKMIPALIGSNRKDAFIKLSSHHGGRPGFPSRPFPKWTLYFLGLRNSSWGLKDPPGPASLGNRLQTRWPETGKGSGGQRQSAALPFSGNSKTQMVQTAAWFQFWFGTNKAAQALKPWHP